MILDSNDVHQQIIKNKAFKEKLSNSFDTVFQKICFNAFKMVGNKFDWSASPYQMCTPKAYEQLVATAKDCAMVLQLLITIVKEFQKEIKVSTHFTDPIEKYMLHHRGIKFSTDNSWYDAFTNVRIKDKNMNCMRHLMSYRTRTMVGAVLKICKNHKIDEGFYKKVREAKKQGAKKMDATNGLLCLSNTAGKQNETNQEEVKRELQPGVPDNKEVTFKSDKESNQVFPQQVTHLILLPKVII